MRVTPILLSLATATTLAVVASGSASADTVYTVKSGDTLNKIASANDTSVDAIAKENNISDINFIVAGSTLKLSDSNTATAQTVSAPTTTQTASTATPVTTTVAQTTSYNATSTDTSDALQALINRESSGNVNATNGQYYGIGQLSPQARAMYGGNSTDYNDQLNAMKSYISARYGSAENAWAHSQATGWY